MSSSINVDSLNNVPEFAKIIINSFVNGTRVAFIGLILGLIYSALLIPLLFSLFFFSTSKIRRQPIFLFVTTIVLIGIGIGIWVVYLVACVLTTPFQLGDIEKKFRGFSVIFGLTPWLLDWVLLLRLTAVYPPHTMTLRRTISIFALPVLIKTVRFVVLVVFFKETWGHTPGGGITELVTGFLTLPYSKLTFCLRVPDNAYVSTMFLLRLRKSLKIGSGTSSNAQESFCPITNRIQTLFWIAASNFVFPVMFDIAELILLFTSHNSPVPVYLMLTNIYVSIIGLVHATVWSNSTTPDDQTLPSYSKDVSSRRADSRGLLTTMVPSASGNTLRRVGISHTDSRSSSEDQEIDSMKKSDIEECEENNRTRRASLVPIRVMVEETIIISHA